MKWEVAVDPPDQLGESPFWHPHEQRLYWVDIPAQRVRRWHAESGAAESWDLSQEPGCIAPALHGGLVLALRDGIYRARSWGGSLEPIVHRAGAARRAGAGAA
jgi:sugar lactone lactonase YvrE